MCTYDGIDGRDVSVMDSASVTESTRRRVNWSVGEAATVVVTQAHLPRPISLFLTLPLHPWLHLLSLP